MSDVPVTILVTVYMLLRINFFSGYGSTLKYSAIKTQIQSIIYLFYMHVDRKTQGIWTF